MSIVNDGTGIAPINRYYYQTKVLPLVYSESLSYYEDICQLVNKINELIAYIDTLLTDYIQQIVLEKFNDLMMDAMYDESTETLTLKLKDVSV